MIIEIVGKPGAGKTALNTLFLLRELKYKGQILQRQSAKIINGFNAERKNKLPFPDRPPLYSNYEVHIPTGYNELFKPYHLNPYRLGLSTLQTSDKLQLVHPYSCLHITEARKYWDGRESSSMPDNVSRYFETHRHNYLTIIVDAQRGESLDLNIRSNANRFIEVLGMLNDEDAYGRVIRSTWYCREFYSLQDYEAYLAGKTANYRATVYRYEGNIFELYESRNRIIDFVPADKEGAAYSALEQLSTDEVKTLPPNLAAIYDMSRPEWYRQKLIAPKQHQGVRNYVAA